MQHPGHLMRRAVQVLNVLWNEEVSRTITSPQFATLNALYSEPDLDQRTLGHRVSLDRSTMAAVVSRDDGAHDWVTGRATGAARQSP